MHRISIVQNTNWNSTHLNILTPTVYYTVLRFFFELRWF